MIVWLITWWNTIKLVEKNQTRKTLDHKVTSAVRPNYSNQSDTKETHVWTRVNENPVDIGYDIANDQKHQQPSFVCSHNFLCAKHFVRFQMKCWRYNKLNLTQRLQNYRLLQIALGPKNPKPREIWHDVWDLWRYTVTANIDNHSYSWGFDILDSFCTLYPIPSTMHFDATARRLNCILIPRWFG